LTLDDLLDWHGEVRRRADCRRKSPPTWVRRKPSQELRVVIGIKGPEFVLGRDKNFGVREMGMEKGGLVSLRGLVMVSVERWRLQVGKQQSAVRQNGHETTHRSNLIAASN
jgi:hypothetical protein